MKTLFYPYKIMLKQDKHFEDLFKYCDISWIKSMSDLNMHIVKNLIDNEYTLNSKDDCGKSLRETIFWSDESFKQFVNKCFPYTEKYEMLMSKLTIWGSYDECPNCGCEFEYYDNIRKCSNPNCDFWDDISREKRLENKYDVTIDLNFKYQLN